MRYKYSGMAVLLAGAILASTAEAQRGGARGGARAEARVEAGAATRAAGGRAGHPAAALLRMKERLALSESQVEQLRKQQQAKLPQVSESDMLRARADLMDATRGDVNPEAARAALDRMSKLRVDVEVARLKARKDARAVLTADQLGKLTAFERASSARRTPPNRARLGERARAGAAFRGLPGRMDFRGVRGWR